jgi:trehalose-phosphatase
MDWDTVSARLRKAPSIALFLDFDGTLAPVDEDPGAVVMKGLARSALKRLVGNPCVHLCIISGRRLDDLRERVGVPGVQYLGVHGGDALGASLPPRVIRSVAEARRALASKFASQLQGRGIHIEDKTLAFAVHHRRAGPSDVELARGILGAVVERSAGALWVTAGDCVWEVLPREIPGKGYAARREWRRWPAALPIYVGNDGTDEEAFAALASGITARVGTAPQTNARYLLRDPAEVAWFLRRVEEEA